MGQIIGSAAKPKRCNLQSLSSFGTPAAGEYILVSSDNSMNAAGQGNFDCYIVGDGTKAATALPLRSIADGTPTENSKNSVSSGGVYATLYGGVENQRTYTTTSGTAINTTSAANRINIGTRNAGDKFTFELTYPADKPIVQLYFYNGNNSKLVPKINNAVIMTNTKYTIYLPDAADSVGLYITAANVVDGELGFLVYREDYVESRFDEIEVKTDSIELQKADAKKESVNLFNPNSTGNIDGKYINNQGNYADGASYCISEPYEIPAGESITTNKLSSGTTMALYDENWNVVKKVSSAVGAVIQTLTNDTDKTLFCRVSVAKGDFGSTMVNRGTSTLDYQPYNAPSVLYTDSLANEKGSSQNMSMSQKVITEMFDGLESRLYATEKSSPEYTVTQGVAINTTNAANRFYLTVPSGSLMDVKINYNTGAENETIYIYYYNEDGTYTAEYIPNNTYVRRRVAKTILSFALHISADKAIADGTAQISVMVEGDVEEIQRHSVFKKTTFCDVLQHWMAGEKFPIGFQGDSTTDGVGTTGWTVSNSHPAQDEAEGGTGARGVVDYVCELAYPKQLENLLRAELGSSTLRIYNIGYYGASLTNNKQFLEALYSGVYSDVKMVGIMLGINDRSGTPTSFYDGLVKNLTYYVDFFIDKGITPFMVTNQIVTQCGNNPNVSGGIYDEMYEDYTQTICNKAKYDVALKYGLEVIDMNAFGRLLLMSSLYRYNELTEDLHFKDLGHKLEAGYLFSELIPWVNKTGDARKIHLGINCARSRTSFNVGKYDTEYTNDAFKLSINHTRSESTDICIFDTYVFVDNKDGRYSVTYLAPAASGYIVVDGDTSNPIAITSTEMPIGTWDIGLHHVQVYTGNNTKVAFKGFLLEQVLE